MSNNVYKRFFALTAALMLALLPATAFAAVEASAVADKTTVQAGDVVEVTITVTGKELAAVNLIRAVNESEPSFSADTMPIKPSEAPPSLSV